MDTMTHIMKYPYQWQKINFHGKNTIIIKEFVKIRKINVGKKI